MIDTMWVAQAAQSGSVSGQASGAMLRSALADLTSAFEEAGLSLIFITLVCQRSTVVPRLRVVM